MKSKIRMLEVKRCSDVYGANSSPNEINNKKIDWSSLYKKEDWWAVWIG
jgi:hypothetical protein